MHGLELLRLGPDCLSLEASFILAEDVLCGTNVFNVDQKVSNQIAAYDPLGCLHGRPANYVLYFPM